MIVPFLIVSVGFIVMTVLYARERGIRIAVEQRIKRERVARVDRDIRNQAVADTVVRPFVTRRRTSRR